MLRRSLAAFILSLAFAFCLAPGLALAVDGSGIGAEKSQLTSQGSLWGWVSVEGGNTFYGTPQTVTVKGLTESYTGNSGTNKARFIMYKDGSILYQEDVWVSKEDWYNQVPAKWSCVLSEVGNYKVEFFQIYDYGWGWQRKGDIHEASFAILKDKPAAKKANPMTVKVKTVTVKASSAKKKAQSVKASKAFAVKNARGAVTYKATKNVTKNAMKKVTVAKNGIVTVKKGTKAGTYKLNVKVAAAGDKAYESGSKTVTLTVKVK